jgi:hypothetical protein
MSADISEILKSWPFKPGQVSARRIRGADGKEKLQLRLDLGLLQMEIQGRPDGRRPHGQESLLDYHQRRLARHVEQAGSEEGFLLGEKECEALRSEATLFYHRYLAEFVLGEYAAVVRDTGRNIAVMDFCRRYAREETDRYCLEEFRPYLLMMRARAGGHQAMNDSRPREALETLRQAIAEIETLYEALGDDKLAEQSSEIGVLRSMEKDLLAQLPPDPVEKLRRELADALEAEHYEQAARLRDELRRLTGTP